jgi:hypothetical protein
MHEGSAAMRRSGLPVLLLLVLAAACAPGAATPGARPAPSNPNVHPGFDARVYPGEAAMRAWRESSPYRWVGYYLPAPCHRDASFSGTRPALERMGWGMAILYVGQQAFEGAAPPDTTTGRPIVCSRTLLTAERGRADARDAVARTRGEGFPAGSVIYLDVERTSAVPDSLLAYYDAWTGEVLRDGTYLPGTYAHQANAARLFAAARAAYERAGRAGSPPFWVAGGSGFSLDQPPYAVGLTYARVWQGVLDADRSWGGVSLRVDENVSDRPNPSAPSP